MNDKVLGLIRPWFVFDCSTIDLRHVTVTNLQAITQRLGTLMCKMTLILIQNELEITNAIRFAWFTGNNAKSV